MRPGNALNAPWAALGNNARLSQYVAVAKQRAAAADAFARGLSAGHWPPEAQQPVRALIPYILQQHIAWESVSRSQSVQEVFDSSGVAALNDPAGPAAAAAVRIALGLPSN